LRFASGIDLDPLEGGSASSRRRAVAPTVRGEWRRRAAAFTPDVLNKGLGADRPPSEARKRGWRLVAIRSPTGPHGEHFSANVPVARTRHTRYSNRE
jgi:hypothetical protein